MRGIAARLGVSATALYQHFENKASILREIRLYGADLLQTEVIERPRPTATRSTAWPRWRSNTLRSPERTSGCTR